VTDLLSAVLPHDAYGRDHGLFIADKLPCVLGSSLAGIVEQLGPDDTSPFKVGDHVFGISNMTSPTSDQAGLQQYAILQTESIALVPGSVTDDDQAATFPVNIATVAITLFTKDFGFNFPAPWEDKPFDLTDDPIVILGAGTNAARLFTRVATKVLGIKNIIAVASLSNKSELLEAGASHIIDRHLSEELIIAQVHKAANGAENVTRIFDCASWDHHLAAALFAKDKTSRLATLHPVDETKVQENRPLCKATLVQMTNANLGSHAKFLWQTLPTWIEAGIIRPTAFYTIDGLDVEGIDKQLDEYVVGKGLTHLIVHP
jgi:NADPH2:quinone reductase